MSYDDDAKMKLLKEAWNKMEEGDATYGAKVPGAVDPNGKNGLKDTKSTGTAVEQGPSVRGTIAKPSIKAENLAEEEGDDPSAPPVGGGDEMDAAGADDALAGDAAMGGEMGAPMSPWDQLVAAVEQMKAALEQIAAEEKGEPAHQGGEMGGEAGLDTGAPVPGGEAPDMGGGEEDIGAVAEAYLEEAKKKIAEKIGKKSNPKGFQPKNK